MVRQTVAGHVICSPSAPPWRTATLREVIWTPWNVNDGGRSWEENHTKTHVLFRSVQVQPATKTCYQCVHVQQAWKCAASSCSLLFSITLTHSLLQDYGSNMLSTKKKKKKKRSLQATAEKNCTRYAQLMITSSTLAASQQSLLNSLSGQRGNAQKMKWINASRRQKAEAGGTKPLVVHLFPHLSPPALTFHLLKSSR